MNIGRYELVPVNAGKFVFALLHLGFSENETWQGCASWQCKTTQCWVFLFVLFSFSRCILPFFLMFFGDLDPPPLTNAYVFFAKKASSGSVCIVVKHNRAKRRFPTLENQHAKKVPVQSK